MRLNMICFTLTVLFLSTSATHAEWLRVPITGSGTRHDMYRPDLPAGLKTRTVIIQANKDGKPLHSDCFVWIPGRVDLDGVTLRPGSVRFTRDAAIKAILQRHPNLALSAMEKVQ